MKTYTAITQQEVILNNMILAIIGAIVILWSAWAEANGAVPTVN